MSKLETPAPTPRPTIRRRLSQGLVPFSLGGRQRCPYCHDGLREGEDLVACSACRAIYHRECLGFEGQCLTFGCPHAPEAIEPRTPRRRAARGAVLLGLLLTTLGLGWWLLHVPTPPILPPNEGPLNRTRATITAPVNGAAFLEGEPVTIRGWLQVDECFEGLYPRSFPVFVRGRQVGSARVRGGMTIRGDVRLPPGSHELRIALPTRTHVVRVHVKRRSGGVAPQLDLAGQVTGGEVMVRGRLRGRGPVQVTVSGAGQSLSYAAQAPGPFATVLTLPHVGHHRVFVEVRDAEGRVQRAEGVVRRTR